MSDRAPQIESKAPGEAVDAIISFTGKLAAGDTLTGTPTCVSSPTGLSFDQVAYNTANEDVAGETVAASRAVKFRVSGGAAGTLYEITVTAPSTTSGQADLKREAMLEVC